MDALSRLLSLFLVRTTLDVRCELAAPWVLSEPSAPVGVAPFHIVLAGSASVEIPGQEAMLLQAGDMLVFPGGSAHSLLAGGSDALEVPSPVVNVTGAGPLPLKQNDGPGAASEILCGHFSFDGSGQTTLLPALPAVLVVRAHSEANVPGLRALVALLRHETGEDRPGASAVIAQLSGALFTLLLRAWLSQSATTPGLFAVLADRRLGPALKRMLDSPERPWQVQELAAHCHMSRATFARLFARLCDLPPAELLTRLRMARAGVALAQGEQTVGDVAYAVGYESESAFNRAFTRYHGVGPGSYRRAASARQAEGTAP